MYKMVQDLSRDELNELKSSFFYQDETRIRSIQEIHDKIAGN